MKKYIFSFLALTGLFTASCSNDEIKIETEEYVANHVVTFDVATDFMYEELGVKSGMKNQILSDDKSHIGIFTYIYDDKGDIVDSLFSQTKTFAQISQQVTLKEGKYTVVSVETVVNKNYDYVPDRWRLINTNKLSDCEIHSIGDHSWFEAVGVASTTITVVKDETYKLSPVAYGSIIDIDYYNFDKSNYEAIRLYTRNQAAGIKLNPELSGDSRFTWDIYTEEHYWYSRGGTARKSQLDAKGSFTPYIMETGRIECGLAALTFDEDGHTNNFAIYPSSNFYLTLEKGKFYYGGINYKGGNLPDCEAFLGASLSEYNNWVKNITNPSQQDLYEAPYLNWGGTVTSVKSYMKNYNLYSDIQIGPNDIYWMSYTGTGDVLLYEYQFTSETKGLCRAYVYLNRDNVTLADIENYLKKNGYTYYGKDEDSGVTIYENSSTYVAINSMSSEQVNFWSIGYLDKNLIQTDDALTFKAPYLQWGATVSAVKSYMSDFEIVSDIALDDDGNYSMTYEGKDDAAMYIYDFSTMTSGLHDVYLAFDAETVNLDAIKTYFASLSTYTELEYDSEDDYWWTRTQDNKTQVLIYQTSSKSLWVLNYYDPSFYSSVKREIPLHKVNRTGIHKSVRCGLGLRENCVTTADVQTVSKLKGCSRKEEVVDTPFTFIESPFAKMK